MQDDEAPAIPAGPGPDAGSPAGGGGEGDGGVPPQRGLKDRAPAVHRFLTSDERRFVLAREVGTGALVVLLVLALLWGFTGQPIGRSPIVVVESGSMMHCENGIGVQFGRDCDSQFGRLGTIDPGDLILVKDIDGQDDVDTRADGGATRYGGAGDVIVFRPDGLGSRTPVIHRALFYLQVNDDGSFTIPELGLDHVNSLDDPRIQRLGLNPSYASTMRDSRLDVFCGPPGPGRSGFITRGDNNVLADQGTQGQSVSLCPIQEEWILGKARGQIPWLGLVKLYATDLGKGCPVFPFSGQRGIQGCNYHNASGDTKLLLLLTVGALLGGPYLYEKVKKRGHKTA